MIKKSLKYFVILLLSIFISCKQDQEARRPISQASGSFMKKSIERNKKLISTEEERIDSESLLKYINPTDIKTFGLIPELIGRFPVLTYLEPLDAASLKRILTEPKNALVKQYVRLFDIDGVKLRFDADVLDFIVEKAIDFKLGARGLRSICEAILTDAMYELPSKSETEFRVTADYATAQFSKSKMSKLRVA